MRGSRAVSVRAAGIFCAAFLAACFGGSGDGGGTQQGGGENILPGAGTSGGGAGTTGVGGAPGVGGGGTGTAGSPGTAGASAGGGTAGSGADCPPEMTAICRLCKDGSCGSPVCVNGNWQLVCPEDPPVGGTGGGDCFVGGCSSQLCTDQPDAASTCEWREEYACYQKASCERQSDGQCGWTKTAELEACLGGGGGFRWYLTCGDPVCGFPSPPTGEPMCTTEVVGEPCREGAPACDPGGGCGENLVCASSDPTNGGLCPISRREHKADIEYLDEAGREAFAREIEAVRLATYRYKQDPAARTHLGFIMEDVEPSVSANSARGVVDLYGYMSMAVAALQEQRGEIDALKRDLKKLRRECR